MQLNEQQEQLAAQAGCRRKTGSARPATQQQQLLLLLPPIANSLLLAMRLASSSASSSSSRYLTARFKKFSIKLPLCSAKVVAVAGVSAALKPH